MNADDFIQALRDSLSPLVRAERTVLVEFDAGYLPGRAKGHVAVNFVNLPVPRFRQRRGGGAEAENNRQLFFVRGFHDLASLPANRLTVEQLTNEIGRPGSWAPKMRKKTADPAKIAAYLGAYINEVAAEHDPNLSHE